MSLYHRPEHFLHPWTFIRGYIRRSTEAVRSSASARALLEASNISEQKLDSATRRIIAFRRRQDLFQQRFGHLGSTQTRDNTWQPHLSLHRPQPPGHLSLSALVAAGAHLGHTRSLTSPSFLPYSYGYRSGITIINLDHTLPLLRRATNVVRAVAEADGMVLFVGTSDTLRPVVEKAASRMGRNGFFLHTRWLPGLLTNPFEVFGEETARTTQIKPDLVIFLNPLQNTKAIRECAIARIPTIAIIDSNADPRLVLYPIPANDESVRTAELIAGTLSLAGRDGVQARLRRQKEEVEEQAERAEATKAIAS
ncbi:ribosomal protein S2, flavodoxin-like domain-containing protein [Cantharellus anzutake]|uniref:ribosomal protein S2, flavodoxin-like domain-containing protein n=1 Tax=Cantharellus anzutake TaxID=1750568 RepID=UPI001905CE09|nr:ribosomal protein S2, flavodoxin-like domain-containing protein [Cantharellus anzutake]KAF8344161.1 ribosomal protein S2, flavodoxin-like domain-containing protein [Cantharellus anzutake]